MRWWVFGSLALLAAGCLDGPAADSTEPAPVEPDEDGRTSRGGAAEQGGGHYDSTFALQLNPDGTGGTICVNSTCSAHSDCILFWDEEAEYVVSNGTAVLTWDPGTPLAEELVLVVSGTRSFTASGPSPLSVPFDLVEPDHDALGITFGVDHQAPNVPVLQDAALQLVFDFEGDLPSPIRSSCSTYP